MIDHHIESYNIESKVKVKVKYVLNIQKTKCLYVACGVQGALKHLS